MNYFVILLFLCGGLFVACSDSDVFEEELGVSQLEVSLNLMAPSGERIAPNVSALKTMTGIGEKEIVKIEYANCSSGYIASVYYIDEDNEVASFVLYDNIGPVSASKDVKSRSLNGSTRAILVDCVPGTDSTATCKKCRVIIHAEEEEIDKIFTCDCKRPDNGTGCQKTETQM